MIFSELYGILPHLQNNKKKEVGYTVINWRHGMDYFGIFFFFNQCLVVT